MGAPGPLSLNTASVKGRWGLADAIEGWLDLLFVEVILDNLGTAMVRACEQSSYAPLLRIARLLRSG